MSIYFKEHKLTKPYKGTGEVDRIMKNDYQYWPQLDYSYYLYVWVEDVSTTYDKRGKVHYSNNPLTSDYFKFKSGEQWELNYPNQSLLPYITDITFDNVCKPLSLKYLINPHRNNWIELYSIDISNLDTSETTDMSRAFNYITNYSSKLSLDLSSFDTSKVTTMEYMFSSATGIESLNLSSFDTSKVTNMQGMFSSCTSLNSLDVTSFDTSNATTMRIMFNNCSSLTTLNVDSFDVSTAAATGDLTLSSMFANCSGLTNIYCNNDWQAQTGKEATFASGMFYGCTSLPNYNSSKVTIGWAKPIADGGYFTTV